MKCPTRLLHATVLAAATLIAPMVVAAELPRADPASVGLSAERLKTLDAHFEKKIAAGDFPGAITMVIRDGKVAHLSLLGKRTENGEPMTDDTIFRIYSMTKPIVSVAALMLVEEGRLSLSDPVHKHLPEYRELTVATGKSADGAIESEPAKRVMTVYDLIRHTSGLTYGFFGVGPARDALNASDVASGERNNREFARKLATLPLEHEPGTRWEYGYSTDVLGAVIEVIENKPLGQVLTQRVLAPLDMTDTAFSVADPANHARIAEPLADDRMIGNIPVADSRVDVVFESGGGGLQSTIRDYARFAQMLMNGGELDGVRILSPYTVAYMTSDHLGSDTSPGKYYLPGAGYGFGLGFAVRQHTGMAPAMGSAGEYNWGGAAGTYYFADPQERMVVLYMMQSPRHRVPLRSELRNLVYGALTSRTAAP